MLSTRSPARTTRSSTTSGGCPSSTRCGRPRRSARAALSGALDDAADADAASAAHEVGQAKSALEATDDNALRALGERLAEALAVDRRRIHRARRLSDRIAKRCKHFGDQAGQAERTAGADPQVRRRHRRCPGVGARVAGSPRAAGCLRGDACRAGAPGRGAGSRTRRRRNRTQQGAHQGGEGSCQGGDGRAVRAGDGRRRVHRRRVAADRPG